MSLLKHTIASLALMGAFAASAFAQSESPPLYQDDTLTMTSTSGKVMAMKMTDKAMADMMMKDAMPMNQGVMMMMHGGKMYTVQDKKMPDGKMLSEHMMSK